MTKSLTTKSVEQAKADPAKRLEIPDGLLRGLYLVIQPSGSKSWAIRYRAPATGKPTKYTIGAWPAYSLAAARTAAGAALRSASEGRDPAEEKKAAKTKGPDPDSSLESLLDAFVARHIRPHTRPSTAREYERMIERVIKPAWPGKSVHEITR